MTPEELHRATHAVEPCTEPLDYVPITFAALEEIRWLLMSGTSQPTRRTAAVDFLTASLTRHLEHCPRHTRGLD